MIQTTAQLVKQARKEGMREAAKIVEREADRIMRRAEKFHDAEDPDYDEYERLECDAGSMQAIAERIKRAARR